MIALPVPPGQSWVTIAATLDGRPYRLTLSWSSRVQRWTLDLATGDGTPLLAGRVLCAGCNALAGLVDQLAPPGMLVCYATDRGADPGLRDLGWDGPHLPRVLLCYVEESECA